MTPPRRAQPGAIRCCLAGVLALAIVLVAGGLLAHAVLADPDLGPAPTGPSHGSSEAGVAAAMGLRLAPRLVIPGAHPTVTLSEQDLTVIARANNPHPDQYVDPTVRSRGGLLVIDARTSWGPFHFTGVGRLALALVIDADGKPDVGADVREIDAGTFALPGFARDQIAQQALRSVNLHGVLGTIPGLGALRDLLDCVAVAPSGVVLGFHGPGGTPDPGTCAAAG